MLYNNWSSVNMVVCRLLEPFVASFTCVLLLNRTFIPPLRRFHQMRDDDDDDDDDSSHLTLPCLALPCLALPGFFEANLASLLFILLSFCTTS